LSIDYVYSATQKCLGAPPGLSPVAISDEAMATIKSRKTKPFSWYLDLSLIADYWNEKRIYHHTTPVSMMFGLREALTIIFEEGLENRFNRHKENANILRSGLEAMKFDLLGSGISRLNQITPVVIPPGVDGNQVVDQLLREFNIEIGKGLGEFAGKIWRIGLMGESSQAEYVFAFLSALESVLIHQEVQL
jgi:alanine-glyoxylate transaminase/serine-glyoxylate transaminase/serine-pyruvate transaminase